MKLGRSGEWIPRGLGRRAGRGLGVREEVREERGIDSPRVRVEDGGDKDGLLMQWSCRRDGVVAE